MVLRRTSQGRNGRAGRNSADGGALTQFLRVFHKSSWRIGRVYARNEVAVCGSRFSVNKQTECAKFDVNWCNSSAMYFCFVSSKRPANNVFRCCSLDKPRSCSSTNLRTCNSFPPKITLEQTHFVIHSTSWCEMVQLFDQNAHLIRYTTRRLSATDSTQLFYDLTDLKPREESWRYITWTRDIFVPSPDAWFQQNVEPTCGGAQMMVQAQHHCRSSQLTSRTNIRFEYCNDWALQSKAPYWLKTKWRIATSRQRYLCSIARCLVSNRMLSLHAEKHKRWCKHSIQSEAWS